MKEFSLEKNEVILRVSRICYQCGECTAACPLRRVSQFNPRSILYNINAGIADNGDNCLWNCLICENCSITCPQGVDFPALILDLRREEKVSNDILAHREFSVIADFMTFFDKGVPTEFKGETAEDSEYGYFPGCLDYLDLFMDVGVNFHEIGDYAVTLLNKIGITPQIVSLKCCGHDVLFQGNHKVFEQLAEYNTEKLKELGIKKLIVSCAEGFLTFNRYYDLEDVEVIHISQLLSDKLPQFTAEERARNRDIKVSYHDPCAFKVFHIYEAPRDSIKKSGAKYVELRHFKDNSLCCGVSGMMNCNDMSKALRTFRLAEVKATGVDMLVTSYPNCLAHLNCLKHETEREGQEVEREYDFEIVDLAVFLGRLLDESRFP